MNLPNQLSVREIMVAAPVTVTPSTTLGEAARLMGTRNIGAVVVVLDGRVQGVFTERDLMRRTTGSADEWSLPIARFMTPEPVTVDPSLLWAQALEIMDQRGIRHLPVVQQDRLLGMLSLRDLVHHRARYLEALVQERTAELVSRNAALVERDRQITLHLEIAARIQSRLLPDQLPDLEPYRFALASHPYDQLTGDYYDFLPLGPDRLAVLIADSSGHGVPAAFVSVMAKMCCTAYCRGLDSPAAILRTMNSHLGGLLGSEQFITMFVALVDRRSGQITYARAGHPLPLLFRPATGQVIPLDASGPMIGVLTDPSYIDERMQLEVEDRVLFYTDGVQECRSPDGTMFGVKSIEDFLRREGWRGCGELIATLRQELRTFTGARPFDDDATAIALEVGG